MSIFKLCLGFLWSDVAPAALPCRHLQLLRHHRKQQFPGLQSSPSTRSRRRPRTIDGIHDAVKLEMDSNRSCARKPDHSVDCWAEYNWAPSEAAAQGRSLRLVLAAGGIGFGCAVRMDHSVDCDVPIDLNRAPRPYRGVFHQAVDLTAGEDFACALLADGNVQCIGETGCQLGRPRYDDGDSCGRKEGNTRRVVDTKASNVRW